MAWFARTLANTFIPDQDGEYGDEDAATTTTTAEKQLESGDASEIMSPRGVKEDLSEITKTLTRQLWGVASFLAPPPDSNSPSSMPAHSDPYGSDNEVDEDTSDLPGIEGIRSDFAELGGRFRNRISSLSSNRAVSEISKIATSFLPFGAEEEEVDEEDWISSGSEAIGVTEEVLAFARNISMHPETWLDFPLLPEEEDADDFDMSNAQQEHALAVEHLAPRLAALRIELCPSHMSEGCFWKIYFVLLHPRLNKDDAERLSTPQIVEARGMLLQKLQNQTKSEGYNRKDSGTSSPVSGEQITPTGFQESSVLKKMFEEPARSISTDSETEKHSIISTEIKIVDKSVIKEDMPTQGTNSSTSNDTSKVPSSDTKIPIQRFEDDGDDWLEDEGTEMDGSNVTHIPIGDEEDVSFSDLEDDDDKGPPATVTSQKESKKITDSNSKAKASKDWVELSKGSNNLTAKDEKNTSSENEWLDVEDIDLV